MMSSPCLGQETAAGSIADRVRGISFSSSGDLDSDPPGRIDLSRDYDLGILPENVLAAIEDSLDRGETHYTHRPGLPALMQAVAATLSSQQQFLVDPASEVVITCGGREGLFLTMQVLLQPGDEVIVPGLRPASVDEAIQLAEGVVRPVKLFPENGFNMTAEQIETAITDKSQLLLLINPSNPTGSIIPDAELARIAALAAAHELTVVADASLDESLGETARPRSIASYREVADFSIVIGSFSHLHNLGCWRVGYIAGGTRYLGPLRALKRGMNLCTSTMSQYAALEALTGPQGWLEQRRTELERKRALVVNSLDAMGIAHSRPSAGPYLLIQAPWAGMSSADFAGWLYARAHILATAGSQFGSEGEGYVRLSLWPAMSELSTAMRRLREALALGRKDDSA